MKLLSVTRSPVLVYTIRPRWHELLQDTRSLLRTDSGCLYIRADAGFKHDGRSGGRLVDIIAPNLGNQSERWSFLTHDILYYDFDISFETTNDLLYQQLVLDADYSKLRAWTIKTGVSTEFARKSFGNNTPEEILNRKKLHVEWVDDARGFMLAQAIDFGNNKHKMNNLSESSLEFRRRWSE
jgi:hypothetical protein